MPSKSARELHRINWGERYGMTLQQVRQALKLANLCGNYNTYYCNGDPHPANPNPKDKNRNAQLWDQALHRMTQELLTYLRKFGFTAIEYNGLYPTLIRGNETVYLPD